MGKSKTKDTEGSSVALQGKPPEFELRGRVSEYHEIQSSKNLSGQRIVIRCQNPKLKIGEDAQHNKRTKYGTLTLRFTDSKGSGEIELQGKLEAKDHLPQKREETGERTLSFYCGQPCTAEIVSSILELRRAGESDTPPDLIVSFAGSYDQAELFGTDAENETGTEE